MEVEGRVAFTVLTTEEPHQIFFKRLKKGVNDSLFFPPCLSFTVSKCCVHSSG